MTDEKIHVVVAMDFSDDLMAQLRAVSPRLHVERHFPSVPDDAWAHAEILYTLQSFPGPGQAPNLRWIQSHTAGVEHFIDKPGVTDSNAQVTTASGIHAVSMAEWTIAMMLAFEYRLRQMIKFQEQANWPKKPHAIFAPMNLRNRTLGIVGYGAIGREVARLADAFGMTIYATKRDAKRPGNENTYTIQGTGDPTGDLPMRIYPADALKSMVKDCDYLVLLTPLTDETRNLVDEAIFDAMPDHAVLLNLARGGVVDEQALVKALKKGKIAGAALDVFQTEPLPKDSLLWSLENVIISPHTAGNSSNYHERVAALFAENLTRYLERTTLLNLVDRARGY